MYPNDGDGHFTEISKEKLVSLSQGKAWESPLRTTTGTDALIFVSQMTRCSNFLYHNKGDGTFEEVGLMSGVSVDGGGLRTYAGMGVDFADYDNDSLPDLHSSTDLGNQAYALYKNNRGWYLHLRTTFATGSWRKRITLAPLRVGGF